MIGGALCSVEGADAVCSEFKRGERFGGDLRACGSDVGGADFDAGGGKIDSVELRR